MKSNEKIQALSETGILIALAIVLSFIILFHLPLGGSVTMASMLPICLIGIRRGNRYGLIGAFVYSLIQLLIGIIRDGLFAWGLNGFQLFGCIILDYILAYTSLGISGLFRNKGTKGILLGVTLAFILRLFFHILSGVIIFSNFDQWVSFGKTFENMPLLYSICYNATYIVPELLITYIILIMMISVPYIKKNIIK